MMKLKISAEIEFYKMSGAGNDFILIDNRSGIFKRDVLPELAKRLCRRALSIGADGLIIIDNSKRAHIQMLPFNSDGSLSGLCGNGARCAARFALLKVIAGKQMNIESGSVVYPAEILSAQRVRIGLQYSGIVEEKEIKIGNIVVKGYLVMAGIPHFVIFVKKLDKFPVLEWGRVIRHHSLFAPEGTNVNFLEHLTGNQYSIRTYERGVEGETLSCGTGTLASAIILGKKNTRKRWEFKTLSGITLSVYPSEESDKILFLEGDARVIYRGVFSVEAIEW